MIAGPEKGPERHFDPNQDIDQKTWDQLKIAQKMSIELNLLGYYTPIACLEIIAGRKPHYPLSEQQRLDLVERKGVSNLANLAVLATLREMDSISHTDDGSLHITYKDSALYADDATSPPNKRKF